jgi:hypothetical protein
MLIRPTTLPRPVAGTGFRALRHLSWRQPRRPAFAHHYFLSTLAVLEQREGKLHDGSLCSVTAAAKLEGDGQGQSSSSIAAFVAGRGARKVAEQVAAKKIPGLQKVIYVESDAYDKVRLKKSVGVVARKSAFQHLSSFF